MDNLLKRADLLSQCFITVWMIVRTIVRTIVWMTICITCFTFKTHAALLTQPSIHIEPAQLAKPYEDQHVKHYLVSEKYDGIRAIWKNGQLRTRRGNIIHAPDWFTKDFPDVWLDGELWYKRNHFEFVASTVSKKTPLDRQWQHITYMVFDAPNPHDDFKTRAAFYQKTINKLSIKHLKAVSQFTITNNKVLSQVLENYTRAGAEGLMLHLASAKFVSGRSGNILKLKPYMDAEAIVLSHIPGKGKYAHSTGALLVESTNDKGHLIQFKIGTGLSDKERDSPPPVGSVITYKFHGYTGLGTPRFASFLKRR